MTLSATLITVALLMIEGCFSRAIQDLEEGSVPGRLPMEALTKLQV